MPFHPFRSGDTSSNFNARTRRVCTEIDALDNEYVVKASEAELVSFFTSKASLEAIGLDVEGMHIEPSKTRIDVSRDFARGIFNEKTYVAGTHLKIEVPFTGTPELWQLRPSTFSLSPYPAIDVLSGSIVFDLEFPDDSADAVRLRAQIDQNIQMLVYAIACLNRDVQDHNRNAELAIVSAIAEKRKKALSSLGVVAALGIPIKRRDQPLTYTAAVVRASPIRQPVVSQAKFSPEPVLDEKEYEFILGVLKSTSLVMERAPKAFAHLDEESIRMQFLIQLNGHYEGAATGETFNASGKTDILIRVNERNIFIAECKFWRGSQSFNDAIDQLLGYLTWRDSKCALLIFNQNKDTTAVEAKMSEIMTSRPEFRKALPGDSDGNTRYIFVKKDDPGREIQICTMIFDVPI